MSLSIFTGPMPAFAHTVEPIRPGIVTAFGSQTEQRSTRSSRTYRRFPYSWLGLDAAAVEAMDTFFTALGMSATSFLWRDPDPDVAYLFNRAGVALGTGTGAKTVFALLATGEGGGDYAADDGRTVLMVNGSSVSRTVQTDARTITASAAPANGTTVTASYAFYRRVRLDAPYVWTKDRESGLWSTSATFREVPS